MTNNPILQDIVKDLPTVAELVDNFSSDCKDAPLLTNRDIGLLTCFTDHLHANGLLLAREE